MKGKSRIPLHKQIAMGGKGEDRDERGRFACGGMVKPKDTKTKKLKKGGMYGCD